MTQRRIVDYARGVVVMDEDEYLRSVQHSLHTLARIARDHGLAADPVVTRAKDSMGEDLLTLQRALCSLIRLAKDHGLNDNLDVNQAKELIRCRVLGCGLAGACDGIGGDQYPCPLKEDNLRWISWCQHGDAEHEPDSRPVAWPPPPEVLAFWESGFGGDAGATAFCTVVALVRSNSEAASKAIIEAAWSPGIGEWRFNRAYGQSCPPGDRFQPPKWSVEMGRWPW